VENTVKDVENPLAIGKFYGGNSLNALVEKPVKTTNSLIPLPLIF